MIKYIMSPYDYALQYILHEGQLTKNRTGTDTLSVYGLTCTYNLEDGFPAVTRRRIQINSAIAELLWFLSGSTDEKELAERGCNYWKPWTDPSIKENAEYYKRTGYKEGLIGPTYGFQLRYFNGNYRSYDLYRQTEFLVHKSLVNGFDQLYYIVNGLKTDENSRRLVVNLWNPSQLHLMRLPPCVYSFHVQKRKDSLDLSFIQRSADFPIGVPYNIVFYATLLHLLALECNLRPGNLIHFIEDAHIYVNQIDAVKEYLETDIPAECPQLQIQKKEIVSYKMSDFKVENYKPTKSIKIPVAV